MTWTVLSKFITPGYFLNIKHKYRAKQKMCWKNVENLFGCPGNVVESVFQKTVATQNRQSKKLSAKENLVFIEKICICRI